MKLILEGFLLSRECSLAGSASSQCLRSLSWCIHPSQERTGPQSLMELSQSLRSRSQLTPNTHLVPPHPTMKPFAAPLPGRPRPLASHLAYCTSPHLLRYCLTFLLGSKCEQSMGISTVKSVADQYGAWGKLPNLSELQKPH